MPPNCPTTPNEISERSNVLKCNQTYQYHCMRDKEDKMIEKCMEISWIEKGDCAVYDNEAQTVDSWKCIGRQGICPRKVYLSNQVMSYSACVPSPKRTNSTKDVFDISEIPSDGSRFDNNNSTSLRLILVALIALIAVISVIVVIVIYKRRTRSLRNRTSEDLARTKMQDKEKRLTDPEEGIPLNASTDVSERHETSRNETIYDFDLFYKTRTCEYIEKLIEDSAVSILIVGNPGSGKSVLAEMLHAKYRQKTIKEIYFISKYTNSLEDVETCEPYGNTRMVYILDDCFEDWIQYPHLASSGIEKLEEVHKKVVDKDGNCVVITISKWNFEQNFDATQKAHLKQCKKLKVIDISTKDFGLDITDRTGILEYQRKIKGSTAQRMNDNEVRKVTDPGITDYVRKIASYLDSDIKLEFEFPLSCLLFYSHQSFTAYKEEFFNETKRKIRKYVRGLKSGLSDEKSEYCTLIYMALYGGTVKSQKQQNFSLLKDIAEVANIDLPDLHFNFESCLIIKGNDVHKILHDEITQLLFTSFGYAHTAFVIDKCEVDVMLKYMRSADKQKRDDHHQNGLLILTNNLYGRFSARLQHLDEKRLKHVIFKDKDFEQKFKLYIGKDSGVMVCPEQCEILEFYEQHVEYEFIAITI